MSWNQPYVEVGDLVLFRSEMSDGSEESAMIVSAVYPDGVAGLRLVPGGLMPVQMAYHISWPDLGPQHFEYGSGVWRHRNQTRVIQQMAADFKKIVALLEAAGSELPEMPKVEAEANPVMHATSEIEVDMLKEDKIAIAKRLIAEGEEDKMKIARLSQLSHMTVGKLLREHAAEMAESA